MTTTFDEEAAVRNLLAPLAAVPPVVRRRRLRRRVVLALAVGLALLVVVGIAAADGLGPFAGIGAADHQPTPSDALDPALQEEIAHVNSMPGPGKLIPESARLVAQLESGRRVYVLATTTGALCVLIQEQPGTSQNSAIGCGNPLSQAQPTTEEQIQVNQQTPPLSFGVAKDNVTSVSFQADGTEKTIPVTHNVWAYEGSSNILRSLTVHFDDGTETTLGHG